MAIVFYTGIAGILQQFVRLEKDIPVRMENRLFSL